jgi:hypothetical protein
MKITPTPPSPLEGEEYRERGHFHIRKRKKGSHVTG